jgi:hypothetical protein
MRKRRVGENRWTAEGNRIRRRSRGAVPNQPLPPIHMEVLIALFAFTLAGIVATTAIANLPTE